jgi:transcriptional regulator with XRE-family HTH domain
VRQRSKELQQLMGQVGISSLRQLSDRTQVSRRAINLVRQGEAENLKYADLRQLSQVLAVSVDRFMQIFSGIDLNENISEKSDLDSLGESLKAEIIAETLQKLESLLIQLPTAIYAAQQNPSLPARNLLPLLRPLDRLLQSWQIEAIAKVGEEVKYNPQWHSLVEEEEVTSGELVTVRYVGYKQVVNGQEKLLHRVKVSTSKPD